jgi:hypothetical protein
VEVDRCQPKTESLRCHIMCDILKCMETTTLIFIALLALVFGPIFIGIVNGLAGRVKAEEAELTTNAQGNDDFDFWNPLDVRINGLHD